MKKRVITTEKEASCTKVTTRTDLMRWLGELPVEFTENTILELMERAKTRSYVSWTRRGLRVWK